MSEEQQQPHYIDRVEASVSTNRDTKGLGAMKLGPSTVGSVGPINGEAGKEVPDFVPTLHELNQLASYWMRERIVHDFQWFACQQTGGSERRWSVFISRRLNRLAEILGEEAMQQVRKEAVESYRKCYPKIADEDWRVFTTGTEEEQRFGAPSCGRRWSLVRNNKADNVAHPQMRRSCAQETIAIPIP